MIRVAIMIAVDEIRSDFAQVVSADCLIAHRAERLPAPHPAIHQDESHVAPPSAKQNTVSDGGNALGGGAQRWFLPLGLSLFRSTFSAGTGMYFPSSLPGNPELRKNAAGFSLQPLSGGSLKPA